MKTQFEPILGILSPEQFARIEATTVLLVGLGGLGGHVANGLVRLGVKRLFLVDDDVFEEKNLNRQLFATHDTIGHYKVDAVKQALLSVNPDAELFVFRKRIEQIESSVIAGSDLIVDGVDDIKTKCLIEAMAKAHGKPLLHGAIGGWYGQLGLILPGADLLKMLYGDQEAGLEKVLKCPTFTPAVVANLMVSEFVKFVTDQKGVLRNRILSVDVLNHSYDILLKGDV